MNNNNAMIDKTIAALDKIAKGDVTDGINAALYAAAALAKVNGISREVLEQGADKTFRHVFAHPHGHENN